MNSKETIAKIIEYINDYCGGCHSQIASEDCKSCLCDNRHLCEIWKIIKGEI